MSDIIHRHPVTHAAAPPPCPERLRRKADQEWEMAGLARQDNDMKASAQHTEKAREYQRQLGALLRGEL